MNTVEKTLRIKFKANNKSLMSGFIPLKFLVMLTFFSALFFPFVSAVQISMNQNFSQGETLVTVVSGSFINQITTDYVAFYRGHTQIPINDGVVRIGDDYYVYASLAGSSSQFPPGEYSMNISGVSYYTAANQISSASFGQNFFITNNTFAFSTNPGAVNANTDFSVHLRNVLGSKITINYGLKENSASSGSGFFASLFGSGSTNTSAIINASSVTLNPAETATINFPISQFSQNGLVYIEFSSGNSTFDLPVYLNTNQAQQPSGNSSGTEISGFQEIAFQPNSVNVSFATNSNISRILYLTNTGNDTITNISFNMSPSLEPYVILNPSNVTSLNPNTNQQIELNIASDGNESTINGIVTAYNGNFSSSFNLNLNFISNFNESGNISSIVTTCSQLNGTVCNSNQTCSGKFEDTNDPGVCCLSPGICQEPQQSSSGWIGWILLAVALFVIYIFYKKRYKKVQPKKPF